MLTVGGLQIAATLCGGDLWTIKAGGISRFILRVERDRRGPFYMVEDVGPQAA